MPGAEKAANNRRAMGRYYTPEWISRRMVQQAMLACNRAADRVSWRVLDPACGDGAFSIPVLDWIAAHREVSLNDVAGRIAIVRDHLFGVDADPVAIDAVRCRIAEWIGGDGVRTAEVTDLLASNFRCGDALLGAGWSEVATGEADAELAGLESHGPGNNTSEGGRASPGDADHSTVTDYLAPPVDWRSAFPQVAAAGGFDLVIGNPPYRRELNAKANFDRIAKSPLGQRWRAARMDLWHYFVHRSLDLLAPGGRLAFIVNSYWTQSTAAKKLRARLASETVLEELVFLGDARLFANVSGRHMIFQLRKAVDPRAECTLLDLARQSLEAIQAAFATAGDQSLVPTTVLDDPPRTPARTVPQSELWSNGQLSVDATPLSDRPVRSPLESTLVGPALGDLFDVRQGMAENPPFVTRAAALELEKPALAGSGVFVLTEEEVTGLQLSDAEQSLLRPYFALSTIGRFQVASRPSHQVLYLTRTTAPVLDQFPRIALHLSQFRGLLQRRREALSGQMAWWHLHWPRDERLFIAPRILSLQMGHEPRFAFVEKPTYVGFSMHVIVERPGIAVDPPISLAALAAILNSVRARRWFESYAKRRGAHLDISGTVLKQFPLPAHSQPEIDSELEHLARNWPGSESAESRLNELVDTLYTP